MIKISNEVKVGAVALITILVFIWLYNFLKGKEYFKSTVYYYSVYDKIGGLAESSPVEINGYKVGIVQSIDFIDETSGRLLVVFSVSKGFRLPRNTVAEITPQSIIAGMKVQFVYGNGPGFYSPGDTIPGRLAETLVTIIQSELEPIKDRALQLMGVLDSTITSINAVLDPEFRRDLKGTMVNLNSSSESISNILVAKQKDLKTALENISRFSQMLSANTDKINTTFTNLESVTDTLAAADIYQSILNLKNSLEKTSVLIDNLNGGKGSAGKLFTDDSLYINLNHSLASINVLLQDMKANPKRYVHFSLFGRKNIPSK